MVAQHAPVALSQITHLVNSAALRQALGNTNCLESVYVGCMLSGRHKATIIPPNKESRPSRVWRQRCDAARVYRPLS